MLEDKQEFYHSKGKLLIATIFMLVLIAFGALMLIIGYHTGSITLIVLSLFIIILFIFFAVASVFKIIRDYPYITLTDTYIQLDSSTKSEATIYFTDIAYIKVTESSLQKIIEIILHDEDAYFGQLSFHNKVRLFMNRLTGFSLFTINAKAVRKQERYEMLEALDLILQQKLNNYVPIIENEEKKNTETNFMKKYDQTPPVNRSINRSYFLKSYGYSFFIFALTFILFYLLLSKDSDYLFIIIISFFLYPFAKVLTDWMFGFKLRHSLDKQKGLTYHLRRLEFAFDLALFHVSFFVAPIGILFLLIRFIVIRLKRVNRQKEDT